MEVRPLGAIELELLSQFEKVVHQYRPLIAKQKPGKEKPGTTNKYRQKGDQAKTNGAKKTAPKSKSNSPEAPTGHNENRLHALIEASPFLLPTQGLYPGGVFLDAIISKLPLPGRLVSDFAFITISRRSIKIVLIEIESSKKKIFRNSFPFGFHSDARDAIDQVKEWQKELSASYQRSSLVQLLAPLFDLYPYTLHDQDGRTLDNLDIHIDYLLVVGDQRIDTPQQQQLIDKLYKEQHILLMGYPAMLDEIKMAPGAANTLNLSKRTPHIITAGNPAPLIHKTRLFKLPDAAAQAHYTDEDWLHIRAAGLESHVVVRERSLSIEVHPEGLRKMFYRSGGSCEHPGCSEPIMLLGRVHCDPLNIYTMHWNTQGTHIEYCWDLLGLFCPQHAEAIRHGPKFYWGIAPECPLLPPAESIGRYRQDVDLMYRAYFRASNTRLIDEIIRVLRIPESLLARLGERLRKELTFLVSTRRQIRGAAEIITDYWGLNPERRCYQYRAEHIKRSPRVAWWHRIGLLQPEYPEDDQAPLVPTVFDRAFIEHLVTEFGHLAPCAIKTACTGEIAGFLQALERR
nr:hypothetical protein FFPRI1PSEUD_41180 [Pseudomonas sp. FFPRI_1]